LRYNIVMKKKEIKKTKLKPRKKAEMKRDQFTVILEEMRHQFGVMREGFSGVNKRFDKLDKKVDDNHKEFLEFRGVMIKFKNEMTDFKDGTNSNFKTNFEYLSQIDDKIQWIESEVADLKKLLKNKADLDRLIIVEEELSVVKRELACCREQ